MLLALSQNYNGHIFFCHNYSYESNHNEELSKLVLTSNHGGVFLSNCCIAIIRLSISFSSWAMAFLWAFATPSKEDLESFCFIKGDTERGGGHDFTLAE